MGHTLSEPLSLTPGARVCIVLLTAVGDVVHALPVVTALKRRQPAARVTWVLQPGPATLVQGHPLVDEVLVYDRSAGWRGLARIREQLRQRPFDLVIDLQVYFKAGLITAFTRAPVKLGFDRARARDFNWCFTTHRIPPHPIQHIQDEYLEFCACLGLPAQPLEWGLGPWEAERERQRQFFAQFNRPIAPIVVSTSKPDKDWLPERWAEVGDALAGDFGLQPVLVGGRSARELHAEKIILDRARHKPVSALGSGLRGLVGILEGAALVLSPDTGPLHMSVALNKPVVSLIGYGNPQRVGPYRKFGDLMLDAYNEPGETAPASLETRPGRMSRISVRDVLEKVELWRTRYQSTTGTAG